MRRITHRYDSYSSFYYESYIFNVKKIYNKDIKLCYSDINALHKFILLNLTHIATYFNACNFLNRY